MSIWKKSIALATLALSVMTMGCQTWIPEAGVTMPTGEWLLHPPQFFAPSPPFPLPNEMKSMREAYRTPYVPAANPGGFQ